MKKEPPENGLHIEHYDDGQLKVERNFKDGELHGKYTSWYESGQKKSEGNYEDGEASLDQKINCYKEIAKYTYPRFKSQELRVAPLENAAPTVIELVAGTGQTC